MRPWRARADALTAAALLLSLGLSSSGASAARAPVPDCLRGRYLVSSGALLTDPAPSDVLVIGDRSMALGGVCPSVRRRTKKKRSGWLVKAVWPTCRGVRGRARLRGRLDATCTHMTGALVARRARLHLPFAARRSTCGDQVFDPDNDEECDGDGGRLVGLRFAAVDIPAGAVIKSAYVRFRAAGASDGDATILVTGEANDTAGPFSPAARNLSSRPRTLATVTWLPSSWTAADEMQRTADVAAIVQEIVARPGWSPGNSLALLLSGRGRRLVRAVDGSANDGAVLHVEYDPSPSTGDAGTFAAQAAAGPASAGPVEVRDVRVGAAGDHAEEHDSGAVNVTSTDLELAEENGPRIVGLRFAGLDLPPRAAVTAAWVQFHVDEASASAVALRITGELEDSAAPFTVARHDVSRRAQTIASAAWSPPAWDSVGAAEVDQRTVDLSPILQEIADRPGWRAGNAIALVITGTGRRVATSWDGDHTAAPLLHLEFVQAESTSTTVTTTTALPTTTIMPPPASAAVDVALAGNADDAEEDASGKVVDGNPQLTLGEIEGSDSPCGPTARCTKRCACLGWEIASPSPPVSFEGDVLPILTARCAMPSCHAGTEPAEGLALTADAAYQSLTPSSTECPGTKRVAPGDPDASYLIHKLEGAGTCFTGIRMPPGAALPADDLERIRAWVEQGAPD